MANIKLTLPAAPFTGQIVTFPAPCGCDEVTDGLSINGEIYTVVDAMGECITGKGGAWCEGAQVSVALDCENKKAYIQNDAGHSRTYNVTVPIPWSQAEDCYMQMVEVPELLSEDEPIIDIKTSTDIAASAEYEKAFSNVIRIVAGDGMLSLWATKEPAVAFPIRLKVVR